MTLNATHAPARRRILPRSPEAAYQRRYERSATFRRARAREFWQFVALAAVTLPVGAAGGLALAAGAWWALMIALPAAFGL